MSESSRERSRRKFVAGVLDQAAGLSGALSGALATAGVIAPIVASAVGTVTISSPTLVAVGGLAGTGAMVAGCVALWCKGSAKRVDDDSLANARLAARQTLTESISLERMEEP